MMTSHLSATSFGVLTSTAPRDFISSMGVLRTCPQMVIWYPFPMTLLAMGNPMSPNPRKPTLLTSVMCCPLAPVGPFNVSRMVSDHRMVQRAG